MGQLVRVKKWNAINFVRDKQINYCPATQVEILAKEIFPGLFLLRGSKIEEKKYSSGWWLNDYIKNIFTRFLETARGASKNKLAENYHMLLPK